MSDSAITPSTRAKRTTKVQVRLTPEEVRQLDALVSQAAQLRTEQDVRATRADVLRWGLTTLYVTTLTRRVP